MGLSVGRALFLRTCEIPVKKKRLGVLWRSRTSRLRGRRPWGAWVHRFRPPFRATGMGGGVAAMLRWGTGHPSTQQEGWHLWRGRAGGSVLAAPQPNSGSRTTATWLGLGSCFHYVLFLSFIWRGFILFQHRYSTGPKSIHTKRCTVKSHAHPSYHLLPVHS